MKTKNPFLVLTNSFFLLLIMCCLSYSCADVQPQVIQCVTGYQYGFWVDYGMV